MKENSFNLKNVLKIFYSACWVRWISYNWSILRKTCKMSIDILEFCQILSNSTYQTCFYFWNRFVSNQYDIDFHWIICIRLNQRTLATRFLISFEFNKFRSLFTCFISSCWIKRAVGTLQILFYLHFEPLIYILINLRLLLLSLSLSLSKRQIN